MSKRQEKPLEKNKLYVQKQGQKWLIVRFLGFDKMEAEFDILSFHETEKDANDHRQYLNNQPTPTEITKRSN